MRLKAIWGSNLTELACNLNHHNVAHVIHVENIGCGYEALVEVGDITTMAQKPVYEKLVCGDEYWYCPHCGEVVLSKLIDSPIENEYNHNHCGGCGQRIDWGGNE